jgi:multidrug efflux pump subunit AcrA (membrane-fusion protein)
MKAVVSRVKAHPWIASTLALVVLCGAGLGAYFGTKDDQAAASTASTSVETVSTGTLKQSVSATGTLAPLHDEELNFAVAGRVTSVAVQAGQRVTKGQALARIDSASLAADVAQARATVADAQAKVDDDASNDASDTQVAADQAALSAAQNQLASAITQRDEATLTAPITGVVAAVNLTVGQSVSGSGATGNGGANSDSSSPTSASDSSAASSAQIEVISTDSWLVNATVDATSVGLVKAGNQAQLTVDGASDTVYGTVSSIGLIASSSSGTAAFPVVVKVTGHPDGLHDGASVTATLIYRQVSGVIIAATALHRTSSGATYVEQKKNGKTVHTPVQVGTQSGGQVQIRSGLAAGDKIVVPEIQLPGGSGGKGGNGSVRGNFPSGAVQLPGGGKIPVGGQGGNFPPGGQGGKFPVGGNGG